MLKLTRHMLDDREEYRSICIGNDLLIADDYDDRYVYFTYDPIDENIPVSNFICQVGESFNTSPNVTVHVLSYSVHPHDEVLGIGIDAPKHVSILRAEKIAEDFHPSGEIGFL